MGLNIDVVALLNKAYACGISVFLEEQKLKFKVAKERKADPEIINQLKINKSAIIAFLSDDSHNIDEIKSSGTPITVANRDDFPQLPLSFAQERLWFVDQLSGSLGYHLSSVLRLKNKLDHHLLAQALSDLVERHEILRTVIRAEDGHPYQKVIAANHWELEYKEDASLSDQTALHEFVAHTTNQPFDFSKDYMFRAHLIKCDEEEHVLILTMHHIASDAWSISILVQELVELYSARLEKRTSNLRALPLQYADYAIWQRNTLSDPVLFKQLDWWEKELAGTEMLELPTDFPRTPTRSTKGAVASFSVDREVTEKLKELAAKTGSTLFMTLLSAFNVLMLRYSGQEDICIGTPLANRNRKEIESLIGFFLNTLVLRNDLSGNPSFIDLLEKVKQNTLAAYAHQEVPFEKIVDRLTFDRNQTQNPLFQVVLTLQNTPEVPALELGGTSLSPEPIKEEISMLDLWVSINESSKGLWVKMVYCSDLFSAERMEQMGQHFQMVLASIIANPNQRIAQLSLMSGREEQEILEEYNATFVDLGRDKTMVELFEEQVAKNPEATAIIFNGNERSYAEVNEKVDVFAAYLQQNHHVKANDLVGLMMDRSDWAIIAMMGILKSGAAYIPIDPALPEDRKKMMVEDTQLKALVILAEHLFDVVGFDVPIFAIDLQLEEVEATAKPVTRMIDLSDLAYVIYTSGSTGKPKGVMIEHGAIKNTIVAQINDFGLNEKDHCLQFASLSFDASVWEIFLCLLAGAKLCIVDKTTQGTPALFVQYLRDQQVSFATLPPPFLNELDIKELTTVKTLVTAGEAANVEKAIAFAKSGNYYNAYGPTESSICASKFKVDPKATFPNNNVPIGGANSNTQLYIIDEYDQLVPKGILGELCIAGTGLARGYLNRPELTDEKFVKHPFSTKAGAKMYKTGDLARWRQDGQIEFFGRKDDQVKIRGYRIELGEIENAIKEFETVQNAVVVTGINKDLLAYVVPDSGFDSALLATHLKAKLPAYMLPSIYIQLEAFPMTNSGKINKHALPDPDFSQQSNKEFIAPETETEKKLVDIWKDLLNLEKVSTNDSFFDIGGHSLLAMRLISTIRKTFHSELNVGDIFAHSTISALALFIDLQDKEIGLPSILANERPEQIPLSYAQERLWFIDQLEGSVQYHQPYVLRLKNELDKNLLETSLAALVDRHEILRSVIQSKNGKAFQIPMTIDHWKMAYTEKTVWEKTHTLAQYIDWIIEQPFDLSADYMFRAHLIECGEHDHTLVLVFHHIASDGWSQSLLVKDLAEIYSAKQAGTNPNLPVLSLQYADFAVWQRKYMSGDFLEEQLNWWEENLRGVEALEIPTDFHRTANQSAKGAGLSFFLEKKLMDDLNALSKETGASLFMTLITGFKILLYQYTGQEDICLGTSMASRDRKELESVAGFFINTLALRSDLSGRPTFEELLKQVKANSLTAFAHQNVPFEQIVNRVEVDRNLNRSPIVQVLFTLQNTPEVAELKLGEIALSTESIVHTTSLFDMSISISETPMGMRVAIEYSTDLFESSRIERLGNHYSEILKAIVKNPKSKIDALTFLTTEEKEQLCIDFNPPVATYSKEKTVLDLFAEQVKNNPQNIAINCAGKKLTYQELDKRSNQLAQHLRKKGIKEETLVTLCIDRSLEMMISIFGIMKAGAAYLPIDPDYPTDRIDYIIEDAQTTFIVTRSEYQHHFTKHNCDCIFIDRDWTKINEKSTDKVTNDLQANHAMYVIYTSGSTGKPKGVVIEHENVVRLFKTDQALFDFSTNDVWTLFHSFCFDFSVWEMYGALLFGGQLIIVPKEITKDPIAYSHLLVDQQVTILNQTPGSFYTFQEYFVANFAESSIRYIIFGGEALAPKRLQPWKSAYPNCKLINMYGITETTVHVTYKEISQKDIELETNNIGKAIPTLQCYVLNKQLNLLPIGVPGEIYVGGAGLSRGYLNRKELTAERFIPNPFANNSKLYKTGDLAKWLPNGNLEYLGRADDQVKIRAHRIELGEIQNVLDRSDLVKQSLVLAKEDQYGYKYLIAYVVPNGVFDKEEIQDYFAEKLPKYMIPSLIVEMDEFPLTANGKIDKKALPDPDASKLSDHEYLAPQTNTETALAEIWTELLEVERVGINDNFFELGGHSLLGMRVVSEIRKVFDLELKVSDVFVNPSITELASIIDNHERKAGLPAITAGARPKNIPLSYSQERLWFIDLLEGSVQYHQPSVMRLKNKIDPSILEQSLRDLIDRHEVLRSVIQSQGGPAYQVPISAENWNLTYSQGSEFQNETYLREFINDVIDKPFDLAKDYMLRAHLIQCDVTDHIFVLVFHHIASDGWSQSVLVKDLVEIYNAKQSGRAVELPSLPMQYADFSIWQRKYITEEFLSDQLDWWEQQLSGVEILDLPTDFTRPAIQSIRGAGMSIHLEKELMDQLNALARESGASLFMTLLASLKTLFYFYTGQHDICIGTPIANRDRKEVELLVGFFINTLALRTDLSGDPSFTELLERVKTTTLGAFDHQETPFEQIVNRVDRNRSLSRNPVFQVMFDLQNTPDVPELTLGDLSLSMDSMDKTTSLFDLSISIVESPKGAHLTIDYCKDLFSEATIQQLVQHFQNLLQSIVAAPDSPIGSLAILSLEEKQELLVNFNDTFVEETKTGTLVELFEEQAARVPSKIALHFENKDWTYQALNEQANQLAHYLKQTYSIRPNDLVGLQMDRSDLAIVAILGILKTGAAYVPIDPKLPQERKDFILEDTALKTVLFSSNLSFETKQSGVNTLVVDPTLLDELSTEKKNPTPLALATDLAYVIYTSGSTGKPKGVMIEHRSIRNTVIFLIRDFGITESDHTIQFASLSFDASVWEIFAALLSGAKLHIISDAVRQAPRLFEQFVEEKKISFATLPPTYLNELELQRLTSIKTLVTAGEAANQEKAQAFAKIGNYFNAYGPTESSICASIYKVKAGEETKNNNVSIGRPNANTQLYIIDSKGNLVPKGVAGELCISGNGLTRGYLNRPELTAEKFVVNPFVNESNTRMYKTGDLARWRQDGNIEFIGRIDNQVKIRGHRIELGEIENCLRAHPPIEDAIVICTEREQVGKELIAYFVPKTKDHPDSLVPSIQQYLNDHLPNYMIPAMFIELEKMPLTINGKVDEKALPNPDSMNRAAQTYQAPENKTQEVLANIWSELLGLEQVGIYDNFFELGGHSLLATQLAFAIRNEYSIDISMVKIFQLTDLATLAEYIDFIQIEEEENVNEVVFDLEDL